MRTLISLCSRHGLLVLVLIVLPLLASAQEYARALKHAGVESAHTGAHVLRHSLATSLLRQGGSLDEIGELLRHQSPNTTAIYAKVDVTALHTLALPWPGGGR